METNSTMPAAAPAEEDEVITLARRIFATSDRDEALQAARFAAEKEKDLSGAIYLASAHEAAFDEWCVLKDLLPFTQASSLTGAAIQIDEATALTDAVRDLLKDEDGNHEALKHLRRIDRLLYSALLVVDGAAVTKLSSIHRHLARPVLNPWLPVEERIEMVRVAR